MDYHKLISERLLSALEYRQLYVHELSKMADVSVGALWGYINGKVLPTYISLYKIATALGISADFLLGTGNPGNIPIVESPPYEKEYQNPRKIHERDYVLIPIPKGELADIIERYKNSWGDTVGE